MLDSVRESEEQLTTEELAQLIQKGEDVISDYDKKVEGSVNVVD